MKNTGKIVRLSYLISTLLFLSNPLYVYAQTAVQNSAEKSAKVAQAKEILKRCKNEHETRKQIPRTQQSVEEENGAITNCLLKNLQNSADQKNSQNKRIKKSELKFSIGKVEYTDYVEVVDKFSEFDTVISLWDKKSEQQEEGALFLQPGFVLSVLDFNFEDSAYDTETNQKAASLGLVYRFVVTGGIIGLNIFYDHNSLKYKYFDKTYEHGRASFGMDYQDRKNYISFNYYLPEDDWTSIPASNARAQRAAGAYDLHFERILSSKWAALADITYLDSEALDETTIYSVGAEYKLNCSTKLGAAVHHDDEVDQTGGNLSIVYSFGRSKNKNSNDCYQAEDQSDLYRITKSQNRTWIDTRE